jgi:hypothetical protein
MRETQIQNRIRIAASRLGSRLFRNNVGTATTESGHLIRFGLCKGSSDLIGWTPVEITADMVGQQIAVFTAIEVKTVKGRVSDDQQHFIDAVEDAGGIAAVARSEGELDYILRGKNETLQHTKTRGRGHSSD